MPLNLLYGVQATGNGHLYRYRSLRAGLEAAGTSVVGIATGELSAAAAAGTEHHRAGPGFDLNAEGNIHFIPTALNNLRSLPQQLREGDALADLIEDLGVEAVVSDFEPLSVRGALAAHVPLILCDNQTGCLCRAPWSARERALVSLSRVFLSVWYGPRAMNAVRGIVSVNIAPDEPGHPRQAVVPPPIRPEVLGLQPQAGKHILVYSSVGGVPPELVAAAGTTHRHLEFRVHVRHRPDPMPADWPDNVIVRETPSPVFLDDFASCGALVAQAGYMSAAEAALLGKPVAMVPIKGQFEQQLNAMTFERLGIGKAFSSYGTDLLNWVDANRNKPQVNPELQPWLAQGKTPAVEAILRALESKREGNRG